MNRLFLTTASVISLTAGAPVAAETFSSPMTETGWSYSAGTATGTDVRSMKMVMQMSSLIKEGHWYRIAGTANRTSGSGSLRAAAGISMPTSTPGTSKLASDVPDIPDRFTLSSALDSVYDATTDMSAAPNTLTGPGMSVEVGGSERFFCKSGGHFYGDPLLYPGQPGAGHLHTRMGNTGTNPNSTYTSLRNTGSTSCQNMRIDPDKPIYATAIWFPSMLTGTGYVIDPEEGLIYYKGPSAPQGTSLPGGGTMDYTGASPFGGAATANGTTTITRVSGKTFTTVNFALGSTIYVGTGTYTVSSIADTDHMTLSGTVSAGTVVYDVLSQSLKTDAGRECSERADAYALAHPLTVDGVSGVVCPMVPKGSVMIFGYNKANGQGRPDMPIYGVNDGHMGDNGTGAVSSGTQGSIDFSTWTGDNSQIQLSANFTTLAAAMANCTTNPTQCPIGGKVHIALGGPWCWDGVHIDTPDHRSQWAYGTIPTAHVGNNGCPSTHPYPLQQFSLQYYYTIDADFIAGRWRLSVDEMVDGLPAGAGAHMDYEEATSPAARNLFFYRCHFTHNSCTDDLGNGYAIRKPRDWNDTSTTGHDGPCNSCAKPNPGRYTKTNEFGMSWDLPASGSFSVDVKAPGSGVWSFIGLNGWNGTVSSVTVTEIAPPTTKGPRTVTGG